MEKQKNEWNNLSKEVESQTLKQKLYDESHRVSASEKSK